ncbi:sugar ABC transporter permease [Haladaptatus caseinilyticus]|uniref:sugar ABC transporter permease n=1 Tax=Haladaptatus caseinilyticus TaxID=2993314 RepID=UPI00224A59F0|nr:ABC transporter permease subunit [Haladaptatus caseinilyticus]
MSADGISGRLIADARYVLGAPARAFEQVRYTIVGLKTGDVPPRRVAAKVLATSFALLMIGALLFPIYWIFLASLSGSGGSLYSSNDFRLWPQHPSVDAYRWVLGGMEISSLEIGISLLGYEIALNTPGVSTTVDCAKYGGCSDFPLFLWNSLTVAIPTVILTMCVVVPAAYALSRRKFLFRSKILYGYVLFTQVGGGLGVAALIALYATFVQVGLDNNKLALSAYYAATAVPFNTWLLKTYMDNIPTSYEEAAMIDGASSWRIVWEVILPLSKAGLATVLVFSFLAGWTEFIVAQLLLNADKYTLPVGLYSLVGKYSTPWARFSEFALTFATPLMLVYLFVQRYIESGLSFGGMEG